MTAADRRSSGVTIAEASAHVRQHVVVLAEFVRAIRDFERYTTIGDPYDHVGATVADAILQANRRYRSLVAPRVRRICDQYPSHRTTAAIVDVLRTVAMREFLNLNDPARAARVTAVLSLLMRDSVNTEAELREWLVSSDGIAKLRAIPGIGPKTADISRFSSACLRARLTGTSTVFC